MFRLTTLLSVSLADVAVSFPAHQSLAGLTRDKLDHILPCLEYRNPEQPPAPLNDTSVELVNDEDRPWQPLREGDIRVQEGFNMGNDLDIFLTYAAFLVDGNPITNLMSTGGHTTERH
ncbi:hypothetical protein JB92DRAFT_2836365 [Gautieria morchelliformis]|nr:hypothetical protein JB92DRAFT_2836365 [Gautieria morchelliformis]